MYKKYFYLFHFLFYLFITIIFYNNAYSNEDKIRIYYILEIEGVKNTGSLPCYRGNICEVKLDDKNNITFYYSEYYDHVSSRIKCYGTPCLIQNMYNEPKDVQLIDLNKVTKDGNLNVILKIYYGKMTKSLEYRPRKYVGTLTLKISSATAR